MAIWKLLKDFGEGTSIHGLAFMVESQSSLLKKLTWFFLFFASVVYASLQLKTAIFGKFSNNLFNLTSLIIFFILSSLISSSLIPKAIFFFHKTIIWYVLVTDSFHKLIILVIIGHFFAIEQETKHMIMKSLFK